MTVEEHVERLAAGASSRGRTIPPVGETIDRAKPNVTCGIRPANHRRASPDGKGVMALIEACGEALRPDPRRTLLQPLDLSASNLDDGSVQELLTRLGHCSDGEIWQELADAMIGLSGRHRDAELILRRRHHELLSRFPILEGAGEIRARLVAMYVSREVAVEATALIDPSVVAHFDQSGLDDGDLRVILSLHGIGEGQVSSLVLQTGVWRRDGSLVLDERPTRAVAPSAVITAVSTDAASARLRFADAPLCERAIHPFWPAGEQGLAEARFCRFVEEDGAMDYRCAVTVLDRGIPRQDVLATTDFRTFEARRLRGSVASLRSAAWFPRRLGGLFRLLGCLPDGSIAVFASEDAIHWDEGPRVIRPERPWELGGLSAGGSPIEVAEGWLVLTHAIGSAHRQCIGAALLDREDPTRMLARSPWPLLEPPEDDGGGYVPGVVSTCGALLRERRLLLAYGVAGSFTAFAAVDVDDLLASMVWLP